jgi:pimeloyl-ACP methyl ester carboxylesterase
VLYGGFAQGAITRARTPEQLEEMRMVMHALPLGWGRDNPAFRQFFAARFLPEGTAEQMRWFSELQRITTTPAVGARLLATSATIDVSALAPQVRVPTLVLHANRDGVVSFGEGRNLAALIPGARFVPLEGRNHVILESEPAWPRFLDEVRRFLGEETELARERQPASKSASFSPASPLSPPRSAPRSRSRSR